MNRRFFVLAVAITLGFTFVPHTILAAPPFYQGKTIRIVVGLPAGGGFDIYARVIARHMGKHIPGNPTIIVDNMPGAGSLVAANWLYKVAKPDGLTIGFLHGTTLLKQALGQPGVEFDALKFRYIGAPMKESGCFILNKKRGIKNVEEWMNSKTPVKIGGTAPFADSMGNSTRVMKYVVGLPIQIVDGYKGTADIKLAVESGEIDGGSPEWNTAKTAWRKNLESGDMSIVLMVSYKRLPDFPPNVPLLIELAKTDEQRQLIELIIHKPRLSSRPLFLPPGAPKEQEQILRNAFAETMKDKEFLAETEKASMIIDPLSSEELEKLINDMFKAPPAMIAKMKEIVLKKQ